MRNKIEVFKVGELVTTSSGEYSDYCVDGLFRVLIEFDAQEKLIEWSRETGRKIEDDWLVKYDYKNKNMQLIEWLNRNGYIEDVEYRELHTGTYDDTHLRSH